MLRAFLILVVLGLVAAAGTAWWGWKEFNGPGPLAGEHTIVVERGSGLRELARRFEQEGIVRHALVLAIGARALDVGNKLQAGEYRFEAGASPADVLDKVVRGDVVIRRVTIAEGLTTSEVRAKVDAADGLVGPTPEAGEGTLLPDTYHYRFGDTRASIIDRMRAAMTKAVDAAWAARDPDVPVETPAELVTLASIVEKETGVPEERERVAAVFANRMESGMLLQSDPTVIYAITHGEQPLGRRILRSDLESDDPYNTYVQVGLPPGPIANPGLASLQAAARPAKTDDLYFVADGSGGHAFASSLEDHNRNVRQWRKLEQERGLR